MWRVCEARFVRRPILPRPALRARPARSLARKAITLLSRVRLSLRLMALDNIIILSCPSVRLQKSARRVASPLSQQQQRCYVIHEEGRRLWASSVWKMFAFRTIRKVTLLFESNYKRECDLEFIYSLKNTLQCRFWTIFSLNANISLLNFTNRTINNPCLNFRDQIVIFIKFRFS